MESLNLFFIFFGCRVFQSFHALNILMGGMKGLLWILLAFILLTILVSTVSAGAGGCYKSLFGFGDSYTDTGNLLLAWSTTSNFVVYIGLPPYGETYFHHSTGRLCDGRIIIDFLAEYLGLSFVPPSKAVVKHNLTAKEFFAGGASFAIGGSPALDTDIYIAKGIQTPATNISLGNQIDQFKAVLSSICKPPSGCEKEMQSSLIFLGPSGGMDYSQLLSGGMDSVLPFVPLVAKAIAFAATQLIEVGAQTIIVPGILPIGCLSVYLASMETSNKTKYDSIGCHIPLNNLSMYHNQMLKEELQLVRLRYPHAQLIYADYYNSAMEIYNNPRKFGFTAWPLRACCGTGGTYNYNFILGKCGAPGTTVCDNPSLYVDWDGPHMTEAAYRVVFHGLTQGPYSSPSIANSCHWSNVKTQSLEAEEDVSLLSGSLITDVI